MAEETEAEKPAATPPKSKKKLLLILLAALVLCALAGGAYVLVFSKPKHTAEAEKKATSFIDIKDMVIAMQPEPGATSAAAQDQVRGKLMKIKIALEISDEKQTSLIQPLLPRVEDLFQIYLRDLRPSDLQGTAGLFRLKEELLRRVNLSVQPGHVDAILFKEIVIQ